jgi:uncharacterized membrane protein
MKRKECKALAKSIVKEQWIGGLVILLVALAISLLVTTLTFAIGLLLFSSIITIAVYNAYINAYAGKKYEINDMFVRIKDEITNRVSLSVLKNIRIFLWSLLFIIPGIVKSYSYFLVEFISRKNPKMTAQECMKKSEELMDGHKFELFVFQLSFIGWHVLSVLTFGILYIYVAPYIVQSTIIYVDKNIYKLLDEESNEYVEARFVEPQVL